MKRDVKVRRVACPECLAAAGARCIERGDTRDSNHLARVRAHGRVYNDGTAGLRPAGVLARHPGWCSYCDGEIAPGVHQVVPLPGGRREDWIHASCRSGGDDT